MHSPVVCFWTWFGVICLAILCIAALGIIAAIYEDCKQRNKKKNAEPAATAAEAVKGVVW